jgi:hypothetical protein
MEKGIKENMEIKKGRGGVRVGSGRKKIDVKNPKVRKTSDLTLSVPLDIKTKMEERYPHKISKLTTKFYDLLLQEDERVAFIKDLL